MRYDFKKIFGFILTLEAVGLFGCAGDDNLNPDINSETDAKTGVFTLFTRSGNESTTTITLPEEYGSPQGIQNKEKIQNWSVFFLDHDSQEIAEYYTDESGEATDADDDFQFYIDLPDGTYDIVAFANIPLEKAKSLVNASEYTISNNGFSTGSELIPMSGRRENVMIKNNKETTTSYEYDSNHTHGNQNVIEVIRMAAKVEIMILNSTSKSLHLESVSFGMLQTGDIDLFPNYSTLGKDFTESANSPSTESATIIPNKTITINKVEDIVFYVRESDARKTHPSTERFMVTLSFSRGDGTTAETHYSATESLQSINRNDHIVIPINVTDVTVDWEVLFYPPIGGYPAVVDGSDEFYYYCDFSSQGDFVISPIITDLNGNKIAAKYELSVGDITDNSEIFKTQPHVTVSGEIVGEIGSTTGLAIVPVTITITTDDTTKTTRTRNIYIRRIK